RGVLLRRGGHRPHQEDPASRPQAKASSRDGGTLDQIQQVRPCPTTGFAKRRTTPCSSAARRTATWTRRSTAGSRRRWTSTASSPPSRRCPAGGPTAARTCAKEECAKGE